MAHKTTPPTIRLGITGGIGSGKSTVARLLAAQGGVWLDADAAAHRCTAPGGAAIGAIRAQFGAAVIEASGALNRAAMRALVFSQPQARAQLEAIIHPLVGADLAQQAQQAQAQSQRLVVFDLPLLVESGHWRARLDAVLVVDCEVQTQITRTMARSGLDRATVQTIVSAQASRAQRLCCADWVVYNDGGCTLQSLQEQAAQIAALLRL